MNFIFIFKQINNVYTNINEVIFLYIICIILCISFLQIKIHKLHFLFNTNKKEK